MKKGRMDEIAVADHSGKSSEIVDNGALPRILVVEDNDELRTYLIDSLSDIYNVQACCKWKRSMHHCEGVLAGTYLVGYYDARMGGMNCV